MNGLMELVFFALRSRRSQVRILPGVPDFSIGYKPIKKGCGKLVLVLVPVAQPKEKHIGRKACPK